MRRLAASRERERLGRGDWQRVGSVSDSDVVISGELRESDSDTAIGGESGARMTRTRWLAAIRERERLGRCYWRRVGSVNDSDALTG